MIEQRDSCPTIEAVVSDGVRFLESITLHYGPEKGMQVWEAMGEAMGREVKGKVFFAMMTGTTSGRVSVAAGTAITSNAVPVIKCIRNYTGMGLKEAKDLWDASKLRLVDISCRPDQRREFTRELRDLGCKVS